MDAIQWIERIFLTSSENWVGFVPPNIIVRIIEKMEQDTTYFCGEQQLSDTHENRACWTRWAAESEGVRKNYDENDYFRVD